MNEEQMKSSNDSRLREKSTKSSLKEKEINHDYNFEIEIHNLDEEKLD